MRKAILGISAFYHDSAAALLVDGEIVAAAQEERFTRKKHDSSFPINACRYVLEEAGLNFKDLSAVAFYEKPFLKFERLLETYHAFAPSGFISFVYDGRYKFARYYAPDNFATPTTFEALTGNYDLELFDLERDPDEMHSLAAEPAAHKDLLLRQNDLLNRMIAREVGANNGSFLPAPLRPR